MKQQGTILVVGSANTDLVVTTKAFPRPGETVFGNEFISNHGGKGANQAVAAARLGGRTAFVAKVGGDAFGQSTIEMLRAEGIDTRGVTVAQEAPSGVALIQVAGGENTIVVCPGANALLTAHDIAQAEPLFADAQIVLMQLETPIPTLTAAAQLAKRHGAMVVLNPAPAPAEPLPAELMACVDLVIPNETEAERLCGVHPSQDMAGAMQALRTLGARDCLITMGSHGVCAMCGGEPRLFPAFEVKATDTTAAGDTFCGALCAALGQGQPMEQAICFAQKAASISVTRMGAQASIPTRDEIEI